MTALALLQVFFLLGAAAVINSDHFRVGQRDTIYNSADLGNVETDIPRRRYPLQDSLVRPARSGWPVFDQPMSTLRRNADSMTFLMCNGWSCNSFSGTLVKPLGSLSAVRAPDYRILQSTELLHVDSAAASPLPPSSPRDRSVFTVRYDKTNKVWMDYLWIPNIYKVQAPDVHEPNKEHVKAGDLLGLVHVETMVLTPAKDSMFDSVYSIGLAYSADTGRHWAYCGDIIRTGCNSGNGTNNIGGSPYIVYTDEKNIRWLYVYYNEFGDPLWFYPPRNFRCGKRQCVARDTLSDALVKARHNFNHSGSFVLYDVPVFHKCKGTAPVAWSAKKAVEKDTGVQIIPRCPDIPVPFPGEGGGGADSLLYDFHSDAAYCSVLGKYLITVSNGPGSPPAFGALMLYSSTDGVNWGSPIVIDSASLPGYYVEKAHSFFAAIGSSAADDCHEVGRQFYIYFPYTYFPDKWHPPRNQDFFRRQITVVPDAVQGKTR
jgi:hypothetical protein